MSDKEHRVYNLLCCKRNRLKNYLVLLVSATFIIYKKR